MKYDNIDIFAIATNGLIAESEKYFILDPLGYYVIKVEEIIVEGGDPSFGGIPRRRKKIRVSVQSVFNDIDFVKEFFVKDVRLTIHNVYLGEGGKNLVIEIIDPMLTDAVVEKILIDIKDVI